MVYLTTFEEILSVWQAEPMKSKRPISGVGESSRKLSQDGVLILKATLQIGIIMCFILACFTVSFFHDSEFIPFLLQCSWGIAVMGEGPNNDAFWCDRHDKRSDVCFMHGDVLLRTGNVSEVVLRVSSSATPDCQHVEVIRPYSRKWEPTTMASIEPVTLRIDGSPNGTQKLPCNSQHSVPAVLFSTGGFAGNPYHDFQDVLIPLFITSQHRKGEVVFVVSDMREWWIQRWSNVLQQLSNYLIIDSKEATRGHCFPEVTVGLHVHKEFGIDSSRMPNGESMKDFQHVLHQALGRPILRGVSGNQSSQAPSKSTDPSNVQENHDNSTTKLRLLIVARTGSRVLLNQKQIIKLARSIGFQTTVLRPRDGVELSVIYSMFHNSDVVMGVHGAGLAHIVFMKRKAVFIQIVPLGTNWPADHYYERPAKELDLQYIQYKIQPNESSLSRKYGSDHPIVRNPDRFTSEGWATMKQIYLSDQNVRPSLKRFRTTLLKAKEKAERTPKIDDK